VLRRNTLISLNLGDPKGLKLFMKIIIYSSTRRHNSAKLKHSQENFKQVANKFSENGLARFNNSFKTHTSSTTYI